MRLAVPGFQGLGMSELDAEQRSEMSARMAELGVPADVITYVLGFGYPAWFRFGFTTLFLVVMVSGFAVGALYLWPALNGMTVNNAIEHARAANALMYDTNFGLSLVLAFFGWIFIAGLLTGLVIPDSARIRAWSFTLSAMAAQPIERWAMKEGLKRASGESDPEAYVRRWSQNGSRTTLVLGATVLLVSALAAQRDVNTHSIFTADSYIRSPFFPWGSPAPRHWRDAANVDVGCNHVEGRNAHDSIVYRIEFDDGASVSIDGGTPLEGGDWLESTEIIDAELTRAGVPFRRWSWMDRDPLHPACLAVMRANFGSDYPRIERLLRIGDLPARAGR
jgi:hypothetical protein